MEWIGTKQGENCIEGVGGGGIVGGGGYRGEGREKEEGGHNSLALGVGDWTPEQLKEYCSSSGNVSTKILFIAAHSTSSS